MVEALKYEIECCRICFFIRVLPLSHMVVICSFPPGGTG
ncbi:hypothetical protein RTCIAT899_CH17990 [Rhizobium tropici CIAT 899]|nr:hypothetical protein RTCIAT899_CH17990 [Rhizobium tropici CIAT 899]